AAAGTLATLRNRAGHPAVQPHRQPDRRRQPRVPGAPGRAARSALGSGTGRTARPGGRAGALPGTALRRAAAASGAGPCACVQAGAGAGRRADRQPRRGHRRAGAGAFAGAGGGQRRHAADGDPQPPGRCAAATDRGAARRPDMPGAGWRRGMNVAAWTLRALLSHWRRHPVQFFSLLAGLWLATALLTGVQALNGQARASYALASGLVGGPPQWRLDAVDGRPLPQSAFVELRRQGWPVSPVPEGRARLAGRERRLRVTGLDPISLPDDSRMAGESTSAGAVIDFISPPGEAWIAPQTLEELGLRA